MTRKRRLILILVSLSVIVILVIVRVILVPRANQPPTLSFSYLPENPQVGEEITFNASESYDPDGEITTWEWSFGDGNNGSGRVAKHAYSVFGDYKVTLKAKDNKGASSEKAEFITITVLETAIAKVKEWAIEMLGQVGVSSEILPRIGNLIPDLLGREITRSEAFCTVEEVKDEISQILARIKATPPPPSSAYSADLEEIQTLLVKSLEADLAGLESVTLALSCFPPAGGMPLDLEESTSHIQEATANREKASEYLDEALEKLEKIGLEIAKFQGVCYGPFRDGEDPCCGILPTEEELQEDIDFLQSLTYSIRTYGITGSLKEIPQLCQEAGLDCYPGAWISKDRKENEKEIQGLIEVSSQNLSHTKGLIVGNEVLLRGDLTEDELIGYIEQVRSKANFPVGTAEPWSVWLSHPELAQSVDLILVHVHPYWEGIPISDAVNYVSEKWQEVKEAYPGKTVVIGETGWPSEGDPNGPATPNEENQREFLSEFCTSAQKNGIEYFYFQVFDEKWKEKTEAIESGRVRSGNVGAYWGLYYSDGSIKPRLRELVPLEAQEGINRPPRELSVVSASLPWVVYTDCDSPQNHFYPTGRMGDLEDIAIDTQCNEIPYSGESCVKISYSSQGPNGWAGIYWQYPLNNWGDYPGYDISEATRLTFWARGQKGSERAEFKVGGIKSEGKPYQDSAELVSLGVVKLTNQWKEYSIDLKGQDLSMVIGGFCWVTNKNKNPQGCTIYLDDIMYE